MEVFSSASSIAISGVRRKVPAAFPEVVWIVSSSTAPALEVENQSVGISDEFESLENLSLIVGHRCWTKK